MVYISADPSYTAYGLSIIDTDNKIINLNEYKVKIDKHKPDTILSGISKITESIFKDIDSYLYNLTYNYKLRFAFELATTYGQMFQAELYALDYEFYRKVKTMFVSESVNAYSTTYINWLKNHKPIIGKKEDTIFLVEKILELFSEVGYNIQIEKTEETICSNEKIKNRYPRKTTITSGEADSFILSMHDFIKDTDNIELSRKIYELCPRLLEDKKLWK